MRVECPFCDAVVRVPASAAGERVVCPECRRRFAAPDLPADGGGEPSRRQRRRPRPPSRTPLVVGVTAAVVLAVAGVVAFVAVGRRATKPDADPPAGTADASDRAPGPAAGRAAGVPPLLIGHWTRPTGDVEFRPDGTFRSTLGQFTPDGRPTGRVVDGTFASRGGHRVEMRHRGDAGRPTQDETWPDVEVYTDRPNSASCGSAGRCTRAGRSRGWRSPTTSAARGRAG